MAYEQKSKWFEIAVTAVGVLITGLLGYGQWQLSQQQNQILHRQATREQVRFKDNIEVQVMTLVSPYLGKLGSTGEESKIAEKVVLAAAEYLSNEHERTSLADMANKISEDNPNVSEQAQTRFAEATQPLSSREARWYVVLASLPADQLQAAKDVADNKLTAAQAEGFSQRVSVYKTKISNHYAVTLGGPLNESKARALSARARTAGLAEDSFAQINRDWTIVGRAPF